jgi:hypothetical protein
MLIKHQNTIIIGPRFADGRRLLLTISGASSELVDWSRPGKRQRKKGAPHIHFHPESCSRPDSVRRLPDPSGWSVHPNREHELRKDTVDHDCYMTWHHSSRQAFPPHGHLTICARNQTIEMVYIMNRYLSTRSKWSDRAHSCLPPPPHFPSDSPRHLLKPC